MKKYFVILLVILVLSLIFNTKEEVQFVFNEQDNEYSMYILEFPNQNVSTNNIENIFEDIKIIWLEPFINVLYKDKLDYKIYYFEDISLKQNIVKFKNNVINKLQNSNYKQDAINYQILGIKINRMKVYCTEDDILNLKIDGIKFKKSE